MTQADGLKDRIEEILYSLSQAVLAQKQVEEKLEEVAGSLLVLGLQDHRVNSPGILAAQYAATQNARVIIRSLFDMRQDLTLQRDRL